MDTITSLTSLSSNPLVSLKSKINNQTHLIYPSVRSSINHNHNQNHVLIISTKQKLIRFRELKLSVKAVEEVSEAIGNPAQAQLTWEIIVGSIAGVIPFIVAGIEFNKRIVAQRRCEVCGGSGLVLRDKKYYFRCPNCGGFLPWQSWRRFFSG